MKFLSVLLMACPLFFAAPLHAAGNCADGMDNDGDGWTDAADPDCTADTEVEKGPDRTYACNDAVDNDGDGAVDVADTDCTAATDLEVGNCTDGVDNDGDGWTDVADPDCPPSTCTTCYGSEKGLSDTATCNDGIDNDTDGAIDAADSGCADGFGAEDGNCEDGNDNDGDGWTDDTDPDCTAQCTNCDLTEAGMNESFACNDGVDNDSDGLIDSSDPECDSGRDNSEEDVVSCGPGIAPRSAGVLAGMVLVPLAGLALRRLRRK